MSDDELDNLYWVPPDEFTALRTKLAAAARLRGDAAAAKQISAARKPTTAAWIVNRLTLQHKATTQRLVDLGDRLRAAMEGGELRSLSAEQRSLVGELSQAAFHAADVKNPSSAVRDDVVGTLQAAIADPGLTARLGRLTRAERWAGFGEFGDAAPVMTSASRGKAEPQAKPAAPAVEQDHRPGKAAHDTKAADAARRAREKLAALTAAVSGAERVQAQADEALSERDAERAAAGLRRDEALARLRAAEDRFTAAEAVYEQAQRASRAAAESVRKAKAQLKRASEAKAR